MSVSRPSTPEERRRLFISSRTLVAAARNWVLETECWGRGEPKMKRSGVARLVSVVAVGGGSGTARVLLVVFSLLVALPSLSLSTEDLIGLSGKVGGTSSAVKVG